MYLWIPKKNHEQCFKKKFRLMFKVHYSFKTAKLRLPEDEAEEVARDMEGIITFYCKSRNEKYHPTSGLTEVLAPIMNLELPMNDVYNCFYAMLYKYIPR